MELGDILSSINQTKVNLIRTSDSPSAAEKMYTPYVVQKCMAGFLDTILYANEMNIRLNPQLVSNRQHYEFLLHSVPKGKRFSPWIKPEKASEKVALIALLNNYSTEKATEVADLISDEQFESLKARLNEGGVSKK